MNVCEATRSDVQNILGISGDMVDEIFQRHGYHRDHNTPKSKQTINTGNIWMLLFVSYDWNGRDGVEITIGDLKKHGVSHSMLGRILRDKKCLEKCDLVGKFEWIGKFGTVENNDKIRRSLKAKAGRL